MVRVRVRVLGLRLRVIRVTLGAFGVFRLYMGRLWGSKTGLLSGLDGEHPICEIRSPDTELTRRRLGLGLGLSSGFKVKFRVTVRCFILTRLGLGSGFGFTVMVMVRSRVQ